jgi:hypothetical protein
VIIVASAVARLLHATTIYNEKGSRKERKIIDGIMGGHSNGIIGLAASIGKVPLRHLT